MATARDLRHFYRETSEKRLLRMILLALDCPAATVRSPCRRNDTHASRVKKEEEKEEEEKRNKGS